MGRQQHADNGMRCCFKADCQQCEHPGDWCSKDAATCTDCGGKQWCTVNQTEEAGNNSSATQSAAEVLAEMESSPQVAMVFGAFAGMALLAGVLRRGRRAPPGAHVPLLDQEAAAESS